MIHLFGKSVFTFILSAWLAVGYSHGFGEKTNLFTRRFTRSALQDNFKETTFDKLHVQTASGSSLRRKRRGFSDQLRTSFSDRTSSLSTIPEIPILKRSTKEVRFEPALYLENDQESILFEPYCDKESFYQQGYLSKRNHVPLKENRFGQIQARNLPAEPLLHDGSEPSLFRRSEFQSPTAYLPWQSGFHQLTPSLPWQSGVQQYKPTSMWQGGFQTKPSQGEIGFQQFRPHYSWQNEAQQFKPNSFGQSGSQLLNAVSSEEQDGFQLMKPTLPWQGGSQPINPSWSSPNSFQQFRPPLSGQGGYQQLKPTLLWQNGFQQPNPKPSILDQGVAQTSKPTSAGQNQFQQFKPTTSWQNGFQQSKPISPEQGVFSPSNTAFPWGNGFQQFKPTSPCVDVFQQSNPVPSGHVSQQFPPISPGQSEFQQHLSTQEGQYEFQPTKPVSAWQDAFQQLQTFSSGKKEFQLIKPISTDEYQQMAQLAPEEDIYGIPVWLSIPVFLEGDLKPDVISPDQNQQNNGNLVPVGDQSTEIKDQVFSVHGFQSLPNKGLSPSPAEVVETKQLVVQRERPGTVLVTGKSALPFASVRCESADEFGPAIKINNDLEDKMGSMLGQVIAGEI